MSADPTAIAFERLYSDGSGVEVGVRWDSNDEGYSRAVRIQCVDTIVIDHQHIQFVIDALETTLRMMERGQ